VWQPGLELVIYQAWLQAQSLLSWALEAGPKLGQAGSSLLAGPSSGYPKPELGLQARAWCSKYSKYHIFWAGISALYRGLSKNCIVPAPLSSCLPN